MDSMPKLVLRACISGLRSAGAPRWRLSRFRTPSINDSDPVRRLARIRMQLTPFRSHDRTLLRKVLPNLRGDLAIGHLVSGFDSGDALAHLVLFKTFLELSLCLARSEYQDRFRILKTRNHRLVVDVEMLRQYSLTDIIRWHMLRFMAALERRVTGTLGLSLDLRQYVADLLSIVRNDHDNRPLVVDPQTCSCSHRNLHGQTGAFESPPLGGGPGYRTNDRERPGPFGGA